MANNKNTTWRWLLAAALTSAFLPTALGQGLVKNPSFESNLNDETDPLAAGAPQGWPYYGPIDDWTASGGGVNDLVYDAGGPFHNNGTPVPDGRRVGFKQGGGNVSQEISGLVPGKRYWIQFRYDARNGSDLDLGVRFSTANQGGALDELLDLIVKPRPAIGTRSPYYSRTVPFVPDTDTGTLSFEVTARGDSTILLDAVTIVQRDEGNFPVLNPSFEASGTVFDGNSIVGTDLRGIGGWDKTGVAGVDDGTGGKADNGKIPDQGLVVFMDGGAKLEQTIEPLVKGDTYAVQFAYNAKTGTKPHLQFQIDGAVVWEEDVNPVGGNAAYKKASLTFKAASDVAKIAFANTADATTVLLDDVKVLGKTGSRLPPLEMAPAKVLLRAGQEGTASISIPAERVSSGPAVIKIRSSNSTVWTLPEADETGVLSLQFQAGTTTKTFKVLAKSVGSAAVEVADSAGLLLPSDVTTVFAAGSTFVLNPSFELDKDSSVGTAPITGWTTGGGNIGIAEAGNPFLSPEDFNPPDRRKVLRIQGGGTVSQTIQGLVPGKLYGLQFYYNGRSVGFPYKLALTASFGGKELFSRFNVGPAGVAGLTEYSFAEVPFTPSESSGLLEFKATVSQGDATLFLDAVSIVPRVQGEAAVRNGSFEASAMGAAWPGYLQPTQVAGWTASGGGYGVNAYSPTTFFVEPFFDNGINSDQDNVFFGQGSVRLAQTIVGTLPNGKYTLVFDYNNRQGRGQGSSTPPPSGQVEVSVDGSSVFTSPEFDPVDSIAPWPGFRHALPFYQAFIPVTAASEALDVAISHVGVSGDETFLIDNVRLIPGTVVPPAITTGLQDQSVNEGAAVSFTVAATGKGLTYRWYLNGVPLSNGNGVTGADSTSLKIASVKPAQAGSYSVLVTDGVGVVGSTAVLSVEAAPPTDVSLSIRQLANGTVRVSWPASATSFHLESATAVNGTYAANNSTVTTEGDESVVIVTPASGAVFFRLAQ